MISCVSEPSRAIVSIEDVRRATRQMLDEVERSFGPVVDLRADLYWVVDPAAAYEAVPPASEQDVTVGSLTDDVASLLQFLGRADDEPVSTWHDLAHLTGILARLAAMDRP